MTDRAIARMMAAALVLAVAIGSGASGGHIQAAGRRVAPAVRGDGHVQQKGRYKKQGTNCEWDPTDSGPDQCAPLTKGRFKKTGDACVWVARDAGPDQCRPEKGRFAKVGTRCVWRPNDSGPDQCNPRQAR